MAYSRSFMFLGVILFVILSTQVLDANHVPEPSNTKPMASVQSRLVSQSDLMDVLELTKKAAVLLEEVKKLNEEFSDLRERLKSSVETSVSVEKNTADPVREYMSFSRAALIAKILESKSLQLETAKSSFENAIAQMLVLNPNVELVTKGLDEFKEVRDEQIVAPPPED
ncbi:uncharacterized protein LOC123918940 isoform X3 [Trifolium pratense]|uniref:uncharacterized protein LOC123918940 isoform X3 n=1 Tax=Trifolium pratense TaxID=57577 RepID=UPI001E693EEA|nr:uncharacterized protein LOC123918940 isoform X3 [Trifolium pratense]